jgi:tetratricopeptide (TPR) repeat protein
MVSLAQVAEAQFLLGNWPEARTLYERALQMSRIYPAPHYAAFALLGLGELNLAAGHWEEATQLVETCMADAYRTNDVHWVHNAERLLAYRDLLRAHPDEALRRLEHAGEEHTRTLYLRAWGHLDASELKQAVTTIDRCIAIAKQQSSNLDLCEAWIVRGRISARQNRVEKAVDSFREAVALARSMPCPFVEGRALFEWGQMLSARGKLEAARELLEQALRIFKRLGARRFVEQAERSLWDRASAQVRPE